MFKFEVGDVVVLKSGGPEMTVCALFEGPVVTVAVSWFTNTDVLVDLVFPEDALELSVFDEADPADEEFDDFVDYWWDEAYPEAL